MTARTTRILVIRFSSIGDIVLTAPAVVEFASRPFTVRCEIHYLTKVPTWKPVVEGFGALVDCTYTPLRNRRQKCKKTLKRIELRLRRRPAQQRAFAGSIKRTLGLDFLYGRQAELGQMAAGTRLANARRSRSIVERYVEGFCRGLWRQSFLSGWPARCLRDGKTHRRTLPAALRCSSH